MIKEKISWMQSNSSYRRVEGNVSSVEKIPNGIYSVNFSPMGGWSLERTSDKFEFPFKVYGLQTHFINHVLKTFRNTKGNLGILLNGTKGTGKSVSAKVLANELNLPIIIVQSFGDNNSALIEYLASFNFDCVFFMDEFEKNWNDRDCSILQIMDGVYTSEYRRVFLLTTNETKINDNLLSRPSRIRYVKEFGNLEQSVVKEYLQDNLEHEECIDCIMDFVDTLEISTIDILKTIVDDVNIHGFDEFIANKDIFNIKTATYYYKVLRTTFNDLDQVEELKYNSSEFLKDVKLYQKYPQPKRYTYDTEEDFHHAMEEWNKVRTKRNISQYEIEVDKAIHSIKVGEHFGYFDSENIIRVDHENHVIVTIDEDEDIAFYYIVNPNAKPSLYTSKVPYPTYAL